MVILKTGSFGQKYKNNTYFVIVINLMKNRRIIKKSIVLPFSPASQWMKNLIIFTDGISNSSSSKLGAWILVCGDMSFIISEEFDSGPCTLVWVIILKFLLQIPFDSFINN